MISLGNLGGSQKHQWFCRLVGKMDGSRHILSVPTFLASVGNVWALGRQRNRTACMRLGFLGPNEGQQVLFFEGPISRLVDFAAHQYCSTGLRQQVKIQTSPSLKPSRKRNDVSINRVGSIIERVSGMSVGPGDLANGSLPLHVLETPPAARLLPAPVSASHFAQLTSAKMMPVMPQSWKLSKTQIILQHWMCWSIQCAEYRVHSVIMLYTAYSSNTPIHDYLYLWLCIQ